MKLIWSKLSGPLVAALPKALEFAVARKKAIAGFVAPWVVAGVAHLGVHVDVNVALTAITSVIAAIGVHQLKNTQK